MNDKKQSTLAEINALFEELHYIHLKDMPNIPIYMDQLTSFMDEQFAKQRRNPKDKILTKTMINNYSKHKLLPPSNNKRYERHHIILLIFIYYLKGFLSINDIKELLTPFSKSGSNIEIIYQKLGDTLKELTPSLKEDILKKYNLSRDVFKNVSDIDHTDSMEIFALISLLSFDIHLKKKLIETLIDRHLNE